MTQAVIDLPLLEELRDTAGADFAAELAQTFAEEAPRMLATLRESLATGDAVAFRRAAHSLKSNATTFGALPLAELARALELADLGDVAASALATLEAACAQAIAALEGLCRE